MAFKPSRTLPKGHSGNSVRTQLPSKGAVRAIERPSPEVAHWYRPTSNSTGKAGGSFAEGSGATHGFSSNGETSAEVEMGRPEGAPDTVDDVGCPVVREILSRVGDKWSVRILALLTEGPKRFSEVRRAVPQISQRMLSHTLRGLERDGILVRVVYPTIPPRVEYALSPSGRSLLNILDELANWARMNRGEIERAREAVRRREEADGGTAGLPPQDPGTWARLQTEERKPPRLMMRQMAILSAEPGRGTGKGRF